MMLESAKAFERLAKNPKTGELHIIVEHLERNRIPIPGRQGIENLDDKVQANRKGIYEAEKFTAFELD